MTDPPSDRAFDKWRELVRELDRRATRLIVVAEFQTGPDTAQVYHHVKGTPQDARCLARFVERRKDSDE